MSNSVKQTVQYVELSDDESINEHIKKATKIVHKYNSLKEELAGSSTATDQCECSDMDDESEEEDEPTTSDEEFIASDSEASTVVIPDPDSVFVGSPVRPARQVACTTPPVQLAPFKPPSILKSRMEARQAMLENKHNEVQEQWMVLQAMRKTNAIRKNWRFYADVFVDSIPGETREKRMKLMELYMTQQLKEL